MKKRILFILIGLICSSLFFVFTFVVRSDALRPLDFDITVKVQDNLPEKAYEYLDLITQLARFTIISIILLGVMLISRQWWQMGVVFGLYVAAHLLELVGKMILSQPPPPFMFFKLPSHAWFPDNYVPEGNSYPSGHSLRVFFFAVVISALIVYSKKLPPWIKIGCVSATFLFAGIVSVAKVALGQHWATDVIAGALLGIGTALVSVGLFNISLRSSKQKGESLLTQ